MRSIVLHSLAGAAAARTAAPAGLRPPETSSERRKLLRAGATDAPAAVALRGTTSPITQMLGHASLKATQIYTQVSIRKLKEIHAATHPSAHLERSARNDEEK